MPFIFVLAFYVLSLWRKENQQIICLSSLFNCLTFSSLWQFSLCLFSLIMLLVKAEGSRSPPFLVVTVTEGLSAHYIITPCTSDSQCASTHTLVCFLKSCVPVSKSVRHYRKTPRQEMVGDLLAGCLLVDQVYIHVYKTHRSLLT
jgi:hypothetical protein